MSGDGELPERAHGFLSPVEPGEGTAAPLPSLREPTPLLTRRQRFTLVGVLLAVTVALVARHASGRPEVAANSPPPYPSQIARATYGGPLPAGTEAFALRLVAHNDGPGPVEVLDVQQTYRGVTLLVAGELPRTVGPGESVELQVTLRVTDCAGAPKDAELPFLDVTLRNARAMETVSQILGDAYARDLSRALHSTCPDSDIRTSTTSPSAPDTPVR